MRTPDTLLSAADDAVRAALAAGASEAEAYVKEGEGTSVLTKGDRVLANHHHDAGIAIRVLLDGRRGQASQAGLQDLPALARRAVDHTRRLPVNEEVRPFPQPDATLAGRTPCRVDATIQDLDPGRLHDVTQHILDAARRPGITFAAATATSGHHVSAIANSHGVSVWDQGGGEKLVLEVRASGDDGGQRAAWDMRDGDMPLDADACVDAAAAAATRATAALASEPLRRPVEEAIMAPPVTSQIVRRFVNGLDGRKALAGQSRFADRIGEPVAHEALTLTDGPGPQGRRIDDEGVAAGQQTLVSGGKLHSFLLDSATAQRMDQPAPGRGMRSGWGAAVTAKPIKPVVAPGTAPHEALLDGTDSAVILEEPLTGMFTANLVTGDFSVIAPVAHVQERGTTRPIARATVTGNIFAILDDIKALSSDGFRYGGYKCPWMHAGGVSCMTS